MRVMVLPVSSRRYRLRGTVILIHHLRLRIVVWLAIGMRLVGLLMDDLGLRRPIWMR